MSSDNCSSNSNSIILCDITKSLLLIVDIQQRLMLAMPDKSADMMLHNTQILLQAADNLEIPVVATEQYPKGLGHTETSIKDAFPEQTPIYEKTGFSCCDVNGFVEFLKQSGRSQIIIAGLETHVCVLQTAFQLRDAGFSVFVVQDATCSRKSEHQSNALERMRYHGIEISNHESVLMEWLRDASHPDFKSLSMLIR